MKGNSRRLPRKSKGSVSGAELHAGRTSSARDSPASMAAFSSKSRLRGSLIQRKETRSAITPAEQPGVVGVGDPQADDRDPAAALAEKVPEEVGGAEMKRAEEGGLAGGQQRLEFRARSPDQGRSVLPRPGRPGAPE